MIRGWRKTQMPFRSSRLPWEDLPLNFFCIWLAYHEMRWNPGKTPSIFNLEKTNTCLSSPLSLTVFFLAEMSSLDQRSPLWSPATVPEDLHAFWRTRSLISHTLHQYSYSSDFHRVWKPRWDKVSLALVNLAKAAIKVTSIRLVSMDVVSTV